MARKEITVRIDREIDKPRDGFEGRDFGKQFHIVEMSAAYAEKWAARAMEAIMRGGLSVPENIAAAGLAGIAAFGLGPLTGASFKDAEPLLDDLMATVSWIPDHGRPNVMRPVRDDAIEEVGTLTYLRQEALRLSLGFSQGAELSNSAPKIPTEGLPNT